MDTATKSLSSMSVGIRPRVSMLSVLSHLNYKAWFAVAEFVDNSIQSYFANREQLRAVEGEGFVLRIEVWLDQDNKLIEVRDNAAGIRGQDFPRAFRPAEVPPDRTGLSEFGMGMKTAACWFSNSWNVRTKALGEDVERHIAFDIKRIIEGDIEDLNVEERPAYANEHYTVLRLENLGKKFPLTKTQRKLRDHLASIYRVYLRTGEIELFFDEEKSPLRYVDPEILVAPPHNEPNSLPLQWRKEVDIELAGGRRVQGFAALRKEASTSHAGFALFRRNRLIEGSDDETYRPPEVFGNSNGFRYQRIFGELHVEGFDVSHTKDGFRWEDCEDELLSKLKASLQEEPLNLLRQAEQYRARPNKAALQPALKRASEALASDMARSGSASLSIQGSGALVVSAATPVEPQPSLIAMTKMFPLTVDDHAWEITVRASVDPAITEWVKVAKVERRELFGKSVSEVAVDVSMAHPFVQQFIGPKNENAELFLRMAVAIALATEKSNRAGYPVAMALTWFNRLLRDSLARVSE